MSLMTMQVAIFADAMLQLECRARKNDLLSYYFN